MPPRGTASGSPRNRWMPWLIVGVVVLAFVIIFSNGLTGSKATSTSLQYSEFRQSISDNKIATIVYDPDNGNISGKFRDGVTVDGATEYTTVGPRGDFLESDAKLIASKKVDLEYTKTQSNWLWQLASFALPILLIVGLFVWMSRRAQSGMGAVMNIGRSRAKVYTTEKPKTTFSDVAGYDPVKEEIKEVVDFLKQRPGQRGDQRGRRLLEATRQVP